MVNNTSFDVVNENELSKTFLIPTAGWLAKMAFPLLTVIICTFGALVCLLHYPRTLNARAEFKDFSGAGESATVEIDVAEADLYSIDAGQAIQFRFSDYPYARFGKLEGKVQYIYGVMPNNNLKVHVVFPHGLRTDRQYKIAASRGLKADAFIILADMRIVQRIFAGPARLGE